MNSPADTQNRFLAALGHAAILIPGAGFLLPLIIWTGRRTDSVYLAAQSSQALVYQLLQVVFWQVVLLAEGLLWLASFLFFPLSQWTARAITVVFAGMLGVWALLALLYIGVAVVAAVACLAGKAWRYPIFGKALACYLAPQGELQRVHNERLAAAACHSALFYGAVGLGMPALVLLLDQGASRWLRFHAWQAFWLQAGWLIASTLLVFGEFLLALPLLLPLLTSADALLERANPRLWLWAVTGSFGVTNILLLLVGPLLAVLATVAVIRILRGSDYDYPFFGSRLRHRMNVAAAVRL